MGGLYWSVGRVGGIRWVGCVGRLVGWVAVVGWSGWLVVIRVIVFVSSWVGACSDPQNAYSALSWKPNMTTINFHFMPDVGKDRGGD